MTNEVPDRIEACGNEAGRIAIRSARLTETTEAAAGRVIARTYPAMKADIRGSIADSQRRRG